MVQVVSKVTSSATADEVKNPTAEMAAVKMIYGSQAEKVIGQPLPNHDLVTIASGATTCGGDSRWAATLTQPVQARGVE